MSDGRVPTELFLSHASGDRAFATKICEVMRKHGVPVWYSQTNLAGGHQWHDEIGAALARCDWFAVVMSPHSVASMWVKRETTYALRVRRLENRILPILYKPCDSERLSWVLPTLQHVDFSSSFDSGCRALLRVWGVGYVKLANKRKRRKR